MKRLGYSIAATLIMVAFCAFLFFQHTAYVATPVAVVEGSYAEQYAKKHHLPTTELPDSLAGAAELKYESFKYNLKDGEVSLSGYDGIGEEIIVPISIEQHDVTTIDEDFFRNAPSVKKLLISEEVASVLADPVDNVTIVTSEDSTLKKELEQTGWKTDTYDDSDNIVFDYNISDYQYNTNGDTIDLAAYLGDDEVLLIPAYINGRAVTKVSFDTLGRFSLVSFPATVTEITGTVGRLLYTPNLILALIFTGLAFIISLLVLNRKMPLLKKNNEYILTGPQVGYTFLYLIAQAAFALLILYKLQTPFFLNLLISVVIAALYLIILLGTGKGREHVIEVTEQNAVATDWMDRFKLENADLADGIAEPETKKKVQKVVEEIRFSDPVSNEKLLNDEQEMSNAVATVRSALAEGDKETILAACDEALVLIKKRNAMCKANKS